MSSHSSCCQTSSNVNLSWYSSSSIVFIISCWYRKSKQLQKYVYIHYEKENTLKPETTNSVIFPQDVHFGQLPPVSLSTGVADIPSHLPVRHWHPPIIPVPLEQVKIIRMKIENNLFSKLMRWLYCGSSTNVWILRRISRGRRIKELMHVIVLKKLCMKKLIQLTNLGCWRHQIGEFKTR